MSAMDRLSLTESYHLNSRFRMKTRYQNRSQSRGRRILITEDGLKKEDKKPLDPPNRGKRNKKNAKRRRKKNRPDEINPFEAPTSPKFEYVAPFRTISRLSQLSVSISYDYYAETKEETDDEGFDAERLLGTSDFQEMMKKLDSINMDDIWKDDNDPYKVTPDDTYGSLDLDAGEIFEDTENILDFDQAVEYALDEKESREFIREMRDYDPDAFFEENKDIIKEVEQAIISRRLENIPQTSGKYDGDHRWSDPFDQLCWDTMRLLFPKRGKRDHRQNWDHINVSEEVKQKRTAKKAKGYAIWLSMEITKARRIAENRLERNPRNINRRSKIVDDVLKRFYGFLKFQESKFNIRNVTGMLHGIAKIASIGPWSQAHFDRYLPMILGLLAVVEDHMENLNARAVCEMTWTLEKLNPVIFEFQGSMMPLSMVTERTMDTKALLEKILRQKQRVSFNLKDIIIFLHTAVQSNEIQIEDVFIEAMLQKATKMVSDCNAQDISMLLWCCARLPAKQPYDLIPSLVRRAMDINSEFTPQGVAMVVSSLFRLRYYHCTRLCALFIQAKGNTLFTFKPQELAIWIWALSKLRFLPTDVFLDKVASVCIQKMDAFSLQNVSTLIIAFAAFNHKHPPLLRSIRSKLVFHSETFQPQHLVNIARSFAILDFLDPGCMKVCLSGLKQLQVRNATEKMQIYQCFIHARIYFPKSMMLDMVNSDILNDFREKWIAQQTIRNVEETIIDDIFVFLKKHNYECNRNQWIGENEFRVSTVVSRGVRYVIELLNDEIRFRNELGKLDGNASWRENVFARLGFFMVRIDPYDWTSMKTDEEKLEFIQKMT